MELTVKGDQKDAKCGHRLESNPKHGAIWCEKLLQTASFRESPSNRKYFDQIRSLEHLHYHES